MKNMGIICSGLMLILLSTCAMAYGSAATTATNTATVNTVSSSSSEVTATNMVVDFSSTSVDTSIRPGDSGVINLVIKNSGGQRADNIQVWLSSTATVRADKNFYVGTMDPGESKAIPVIYTIPDTAKTGLTAIEVKINFDGFKSDGSSNSNQITTWEIPLTIVGNPIFQIISNKTVYYRDTVDDFNLEVTSKDPVKDVNTELLSSCVQLIGPSSKYVGALDANQTADLAYSIKPTQSGACPISLSIAYTDESGNKNTANLTVGVNIEDAGVDFKIVNVSYDPTGPGQETTLRVLAKNVGDADADKVTVSLNLTDPFIPVDTSEVYLPQVKAGQDVEADFKLDVGWDAATQPYSIPLTIVYKVGGTSYSVGKTIGIDVAGKIILQIVSVQSSGGSVSVNVANIGTRTADGVKATLMIPTATNFTQQGGFGRRQGANGSGQGFGGQGGNGSGQGFGQRAQMGNFSGQSADTTNIISYKSNIKANAQTTFTFSTAATGSATLQLEYTDANNERVTQTERISLSTGGGGGGFTGSRTSRTTATGTSATTYAIYGLIVIAAAFVAYRLYKRRKLKQNAGHSP